MKHRLTLLTALLLVPLASSYVAEAQEMITLARDRKADYRIVQSNRATEPEKFAVEELATFLNQVCGAEFRVVSEASLTADVDGAKRIFVGWTDYAARNAYISLKLQGPSYVKGSRQPNGAWMDRVLLIRPQEQDQADREIQQ